MLREQRYISPGIKIVIHWCLACTAVAANAQVPHGRFELIEQSSIALARGIKVEGGAIGQGGRIAYWTTSGYGVNVVFGKRATRSCVGTRARFVSAAFVTPTNELELLDAEGGRLVRVDRSGRCSIGTRIAGVSEVFGGARLVDGWVIGAADSTGGGVLIAVPDGSELAPTTIGLPSASLDDPTNLRYATVHGVGDAALFSSIHWPFLTLCIDRNGREFLRLSIKGDSSGASARPDVSSNSLARWFNLGVVGLDSGYLQTLANPQSDERLLVLYESRRVCRRLS